MFKDIVTNKEVKFKDLEEEFFKIACSMVSEMFKTVLEKYDEEIMKTRDTGRFRNKGKVRTSIKTKTGLVEYERVKYIEKKEDGTTQCRYLLDEELGITTVIGGHVSEGLIEIIIKNISELSYRACSIMVEECTGMTLSSVAIWDIIQKLGIKISESEEEKVKAYEEKKLEAGDKVIPAIFQEADGTMIVMQGKDRKERYKLVGKEYIAGFMNGEKMSGIMKANIYSKYNVEKIELNATNSDGAIWIKQLVPEKGIYQADAYHLLEKIKTHIREKEDAEEVIKMYWKQEYREMIEYVERLKYKYDGEYEEYEKLEELRKYLEKRLYEEV